MPDVHDSLTRSFNMSQVRGRGNASTELRLRQLLREAKIRGWRRGYALFGRPDFVFPRERVAVFVDGCFWHGCRKACKPPPKGSPFWREKISSNARRDRLVTAVLRSRGWAVIRIWEHDLEARRRVIARIGRALSRA